MDFTFSSSYGRIAYTDRDPGQPRETLIMLHGLPTCKELFAPTLPHLNSDFRVITFDLNDYGASEKLSHLTSKKTGAGMSHVQRADSVYPPLTGLAPASQYCPLAPSFYRRRIPFLAARYAAPACYKHQ